MINFSRKLKYKNIRIKLSIWEIWKKIHIHNEDTSVNNKKISWRVSTKFKALFRVCFPCYALLLIALYVSIVFDLTIDPSGNLFLVLINLIIIIIPLILVEMLLVFLVPIKVTDE